MRNRNRNGKVIEVQDYLDWKINIEIPSSTCFKTVQMDIRGWIKLNDPEITQHQWDNILFPIQKKIKQEIRMNNIPGFFRDAIVIVDSGKMHAIKREAQYLKIDICLFVKDCLYDKQTIKIIMETFIHTIIDKHLKTNSNFEITINEVMAGRVDKIREAHARKRIETI